MTRMGGGADNWGPPEMSERYEDPRKIAVAADVNFRHLAEWLSDRPATGTSFNFGDLSVNFWADSDDGMSSTSGYHTSDGSVQACTAGTCWFWTMYVPTLNLTRVSLDVTTAVASSSARLGIYSSLVASDGRWYPDALLQDCGTFTTTSTGRKSITLGTPLALTGQWVTFVLYTSHAISVQVDNFYNVGQRSESDTFGQLLYRLQRRYVTKDASAGMPDPFDTLAVTDQTSTSNTRGGFYVPSFIRWTVP